MTRLNTTLNTWSILMSHEHGYNVTCHNLCITQMMSRIEYTLDRCILTLKVLVATIDAQWEGMGDVGSARYELALLPPCPTIRVLSYSN